MGPRPAQGKAAVALGGAVLCATVALNLATLTTHPPVTPDEGYVGSAAWSVVHGHGFKAAIASGAGLFDGTFDHWMPRLGTLPFVLADLVGPTTLGFYRGATMLVGLGALLVFALSIRARYGWAVGLAAAAALAVSWGFFYADHYVRWDSLAFLATCAVLALLLRGAPTRRVSLALGLLLGLALDVQLSVVAVLPGVAVLVAWERDGRRSRLAALGTAFVIGAGAYVAVHVAPSPGVADRQYDALFADAYRPPIVSAIDHASLQPLGHEWTRYDRMSTAPQALLAILLGLSALIGIALLVRALRSARTPEYPVAAVGAVLLLSHLALLAFIQGSKAPMYAAYATSYALATLVAAIGSARRALPVVALAALAVGGGAFMVHDARNTKNELTNASALEHRVRHLAGPRGTVMGEWQYWWVFKDDRFRFNSALWTRESLDHVSFETAFDRLCPSVVLLDEIWQRRYNGAQEGKDLGVYLPPHIEERERLKALLLERYRYGGRMFVGPHTLDLWKRAGGSCRGAA